MTTQPRPEPGWFPDAHTPGYERWWTGTECSEATHRAPTRDLDWVPEWTRAMWPALNRPARMARLVSWFGLLRQPRSRGGRGLAMWAVTAPPMFAAISATALVAVLLLHPQFH